jgi:hypothetical protein
MVSGEDPRQTIHVATTDKGMRFLPDGELEKHRHNRARFGEGLRAVEAVARPLASG